MCQLCKGTHRVAQQGSFYLNIECCPECGPMPEEKWRADMQQLRDQLDERRKKRGRAVTAN